jgi:hypothetical protein
MQKHLQYGLLLFFVFVLNVPAASMDQLIETAKYSSGEIIPYILTAQQPNPKYAVILMPGGDGHLDPHLSDGQIVFQASGNFLIRSRGVFADEEFVAISTDSTGNLERMSVILQDVSNRFPGIKIYIIGTSRSTLSTMKLSEPLDGKVAGFVHTSSMGDIASFNTKNFKSRHLVVHHKKDTCKKTLFYWAELNHKKYRTELLTMEGGISEGDPCKAFSHHGYNGIEKQTIDKIKAWIKADER